MQASGGCFAFIVFMNSNCPAGILEKLSLLFLSIQEEASPLLLTLVLSLLFLFDKLIPEHRRVEIEENSVESKTHTQRKFLSCAMKSCMADGGRPSGDGLQEQLPNRPELHMLGACVVSVREKGLP